MTDGFRTRRVAVVISLCAFGACSAEKIRPVDSAPAADSASPTSTYAPQPPSSSHIYTWTIGAHRAPLDVAAQFANDEALAAMLRFATPRQQLSHLPAW